MPIFQYVGKVSSSVYTNTQVKPGHHSFNIPSFRYGPINWSGIVPNSLVGKSWAQLTTSSEDSIYQWEYQVAFQITGTQQFDYANSPLTPVTNVEFSSYSNSFDAITPNNSSTGIYRIDTSSNPATISAPGEYLQIIIFNECPRGVSPCNQYGTKDYSLTVTVIFNLSVSCSGIYLGLPTCFEACETCNSSSCICLDSYVDYCLNDFPVIGVPITSSETCQNFISNYISTVGPNADIDSKLSQYCQNKYEGFADLFNNNPDQIDIQLCACHMSDQEYQNFEDQINVDYPGLGNLGINARCLVPSCTASVYKTVQTGNVCNVPQCLVINSFNNNGTFDNSTVNVDTNVPGCADISGGNINPSDNTGNKYIFILGSIILIFIVVLIIYIVIRANRN